MEPNKEKVILNIANNIINDMNMEKIVQVCRDFAVFKAEEYYDDLKPEEQEDLTKKIIDGINSLSEEEPS
tara:strand:+ start:345 stop:554 length:210 start_codon:yes stop_codon:yes gene_type:complete